jgi:hypothetical protein
MKSISLAVAALTMALASGSSWAQANPELTEAPTCDSGGQRFVFKSGEEPHLTRITLCGPKGATSNDLVKMFDSAVTALSRNTKLAAEKRMDLIAQIRSKAEEYRPAGSAPPPAPAIAVAPVNTGIASPKTMGPIERPPEYASLPPLPPPLPMATATVGASIGGPAVTATAPKSPPVPRLSAPRLAIECVNLQDFGGASDCSMLDRETQLVVRADEAVPALTSLRFVRRGDARAEIELAQLSRGKSIQFALPDEVCSGVSSSRVEIQVVRRAGSNSAGQVVDSLGPYLLHC